MAATREQIYSALFALVSAAGAFTTKSRKIKHWTEVRPAEMPAIYQLQKAEIFENAARGIPSRKYYYLDLFVYAYSPNNADTPSIQLNSLLDAIEAALAPDYTGNQTLGGLVSHCWIKGTIETDEGVLGQTAVAIIPIEILVNI